MNDIFGKLRKLGMEIEKVSNIDGKGRIVIPIKVREDRKTRKFYICTYQDIIVLKEVD